MRVVEDLGVLVEVEAPGLLPLGLDLEDSHVPVAEDVPIESVLLSGVRGAGHVGGEVIRWDRGSV